MDNVQSLLEKVAAKKPRKKKPAGGRKAKDVYAPDMSKGAPGAKSKSKKVATKAEAKSFKPSTPAKPKDKPLKKKTVASKSEAKSFKPTKAKPKAPTLHEKIDKLTASAAKANKPKPKPKIHKAVKLGLVAAGAAGATHLVAKARQARQEADGNV